MKLFKNLLGYFTSLFPKEKPKKEDIHEQLLTIEEKPHELEPAPLKESEPDADTAYTIGFDYFTGNEDKNIEKNPEKALHYLELALKKGKTEAEMFVKILKGDPSWLNVDEIMTTMRRARFINKSKRSYVLELSLKEDDVISPLDIFNFDAESSGWLPFMKDLTLIIGFQNQAIELPLPKHHVDYCFKLNEDYSIETYIDESAIWDMSLEPQNKEEDGMQESYSKWKKREEDDEQAKHILNHEQARCISILNRAHTNIRIFIDEIQDNEIIRGQEYILEPYMQTRRVYSCEVQLRIVFNSIIKEEIVLEQAAAYCYELFEDNTISYSFKTIEEIKNYHKDYLDDMDNPHFFIFRAAGLNDREFTLKMLNTNAKLLNFQDKHGFSIIASAAYEGHLELVKDILALKGAVAHDFNGNQALWVASQNGHKEVVSLLLQKGAKVGHKNFQGATALHAAVDRRHTEIVRLLLESGAPVNIKTEKGKIELWFAVDKQHTEIVELLLKYKASPTLSNNEGITSLQLAACLGNYEIITLLLQQFISRKDLSDALCGACESGYSQIVELLITKGADVNHKVTDRYTPLHIASLYRHFSIVELLLSKGANIEITDIHGHTPLHFAVIKNQPLTVEFLLTKGADINRGVHEGFTPIHIAAYKGYKEITEILLKYNARLDVFTREKRYTPLKLAQESNHDEIVQLLLSHNPKEARAVQPTPNNTVAKRNNRNVPETTITYAASTDIKGTGLYHMVISNDFNGVEFLLKLGANPNVPVNESLPLTLAARSNNIRLAQLLLEYGADVNGTTTNKFFTPLSMAYFARNKEMCRLLLERGGKMPGAHMPPTLDSLDYLFDQMNN
jgi:ankyrin repeat protein